MLFEISLVLLLFSNAWGRPNNPYDGYKIYDIYANTALQKETLLNLSKDSNFDFFSLPRALNESARVLVTPNVQASFEFEMRQRGIEYKVIDNNVGESVQAEHLLHISTNPTYDNKSSGIDFYSIHRFDKINAYLDQLARDYPERVSVNTAGLTYEGREMKTITVTNGDRRPDKKVIFVDAGIHAREWIAPSVALYIIQQLVENFAEPENSALLDDYDWIILPVVNPDGYEYSHTGNRLWRKTRKPNANNCYGTDGNRNFDFHWGEIGASNLPCQDTFMGSSAFSESETKVVRDLMLGSRERIKFYLTLHSYGNYFLYPWGYTSDLPENWRDIDRVARAGANAINANTGSQYKVGSSTNVLYPAAGGSDDYALGVAGIPIAITMELPPGFKGFQVLPQEILPMATESWIGIKAMAKEVMANY